jgi:hypothetical protein
MALTDVFGFAFGRKKSEEEKNLESAQIPVTPDSYDGTYTFETGGVFGTSIDFSGSIRDENQLIGQYRGMALHPEVDSAIEDIVNESIVMGEDRKPIKLNLDYVNLPETIKTKMYYEYNQILKLLDFANKGHDIFRRWYVDSKLYYYKEIDRQNPQKGLVSLIPVDPVKIKKIRKVEKDRARVSGGQIIPFIKKVEEYYVYTDTEKEALYPTTPTGYKFTIDSVSYCHSGTIDSVTKRVVGYLQKAIRPLNMLRQIEDAVVIYRISRAPERRIFYVDVGNLPKQKAEQYLREIMNRYRNKLTYDSATGQIRDDRNHLHMLEDFWMPRREGGRGTEITTLDGGQNLGEMEDVLYLQKKLYRALNVPISRLESETGFNMGRSAEITRDEIKFYKFIERLRVKFTGILTDLLKTQVILKGIMTEDEWNKICPDISYKFNKDSYFNELKDNDVLRDRIDMLNTLSNFVGRYYSEEYIRKNILKQTDEEIIEINGLIAKEQQEILLKQVEQQQQMMALGIQPEQPQDEQQAPPQ